MAEQFSLFSGSLAQFAPVPKESAAATRGNRTRAQMPSFDGQPQPAKRGPANVYFGTSSWTYPGWQGGVYRDVEAYGKRFTELALTEYARDPRFRCAGADNLYYLPPASRLSLLQKYAAQLQKLPEPILLCPKVWHGVTVHRYTPLQREQWRLSSELNPLFLDAAAFINEVALPLQEGLGQFLGPLILELQENELQEPAFVAQLGGFLEAVRAQLGDSLQLSVELRTAGHLTPRYLQLLQRLGAAHVLNSWTRMPSIGWQFDRLQEQRGQWPLYVIRALLVPGVRYEDASVFAPYDRLMTRADAVRADIVRVLRTIPEHRPGFVLVNNHLEGHSPATISDLQDQLAQAAPAGH